MTVWLFTTLKAEQIAAVLEIEAASFRRPWSRRVFEEELACKDAAHFAVLSPDSRRVVGYIFVRVVRGEMHLLKIAVAPSWRRCGVAAWALKQFFRESRRQGVDTVVLEVRATNRAAIALYTKLGFVRVGTRPRYYSDTGEDALVMAKKLDS